MGKELGIKTKVDYWLEVAEFDAMIDAIKNDTLCRMSGCYF